VSALMDLSNNKIGDSTGENPILFVVFFVFLWPFSLVSFFSCPISL
jgi:hypothetical protein